MREWGWAWRVDITYDRLMPHPIYRRHQLMIVTSVRQLRAVILDARADPSVIAYRYSRRPALLGEAPATCPNGHRWDQWQPGTTPHWHGCECGGHEALRCSTCALWLLDPPLSRACAPFDPQAYRAWQWR